MSEDPDQAFLRGLLNAAKVYDAATGCKRPHRDPAQNRGQSANADPAAVAEGEAVINFLIEKGGLDLSDYVEWNRSAIAFKNTYGEPGYAAWLDLSAAADNFDGEERCREEWDKIRLRRDDAERLTIASYVAQAKELGWRPARGMRERASKGTSRGPSKNEDFAAYAIHLVEDAGDELWLNQEAVPHVTYISGLPDGRTVKRHLPVHSSDYREVLKERFFDAAGGLKTLKDEQAGSAAAILAMRAKKAAVRHDSKLRVGEYNASIYVDRGTPDGAAIEITENGWREVFEPPIRFVRGNRGTLPRPAPGGTLADFERHFNLTADDLRRVIGFMIGTYSVDGSYPILITDGEQGSFKSTLNDKILGLTDPPYQVKSARMSFNPKEQDLHILAQGVHVLSFDNVSTLTGDAADMLCRIATGGASGSRELYSNDRFNQFVVMRPVMINCIGVPTVRADLLDRAVRITAQPVEPRLPERKVQAAFEADRAKMLGFLFSCISAALKNRKLVEDAIARETLRLPRMADFAAFVEGAHQLLGLQLGEFSALLQAGQSAMQIESVTGDPVGAGLLRYFSSTSQEPLSASASDLLQLLKRGNPQEQRWPAANGLSKRLKRIAVGLRHLGIEFEITAASGHDNVANYRIWVTAAFRPVTRGEKEQFEAGSHF